MTDNPSTTTTARVSDCPACDGDGMDESGYGCETCDARGRVQLCESCDGQGDHEIPGPRGTVPHVEECTDCHGYGFIPAD